MTGPLIPVFAELWIFHNSFVQVLTTILCVPTIIAVVGIWAGAWTKVNKLQLETALKQQMVERGMSADDIVTVLTRSRQSEAGDEPTCASEVVVEQGGEWHTALMLRRDGERYYVHFVGTDMSDNEWVTADRLRVPASPEGGCGAPWDWSFPTGALLAGVGCGRDNHSKPGPVDQDL